MLHHRYHIIHDLLLHILWLLLLLPTLLLIRQTSSPVQHQGELHVPLDLNNMPSKLCSPLQLQQQHSRWSTQPSPSYQHLQKLLLLLLCLLQ
jgi:hypothetical protein